ncbi:hypothetical protein M2397_000541 [Pseudomonas sp. BIGb0381]|uniref:DUF7338 family protein n=1 Tax=Pseudomonas sp. BIGb0381 TaxID=2940608 RepID=UPI002168D28D|nr:hypothetical protein [Pseudomonas sp. BIGb0381]MCS4310266.1 hypothetical protein [Pseudomonas sp. BIGb0381]
MLNVAKAIFQWVFLLACNIVTDLIGLFIVAIAIPFRVDDFSKSDGRPIVNLPRWAWLFGNDYDGLQGDRRGWWAENTPFGWKVDSFMAMWWWAAVRNPVNNMRFVKLWQAPIKGSTVTHIGDYTVRDHPGEAGWQFVTTENGGKHWYGFYLVHQWSDTRAFVIRLGFKVQPDDAGTDGEPVGMTTKINFYKAI